MTNIKPNSIEAVMFFALYICAQDKKIAKEEKKELILDIQVMRKLYFDIYGEFIDDNFKEVINSIDIDDRSNRAFNFHKNTLFVLKELLESVGVNHPTELIRRHIVRRLSESEIRLADQIYPRAQKGELLKKGKKINADPRIDVYWNKANSKSFNYIPGSI